MGLQFFKDNKLAIVFVLAFMGWTCGVIAVTERLNDQKWKDKISSSPTKHTETELPPLVEHQPDQHLSGPADSIQVYIDTTTPHLIAVREECQHQVDSLIAVIRIYRDSIGYLAADAHKRLGDSLGGIHDLWYYPLSRLFREGYTPPDKITRRLQMTDSTMVAVNDEKDWIVGLAFSYLSLPAVSDSLEYPYGQTRQEARSISGIGGNFGRKPIVLSATWYQNKTWEARLNLLWEF